MDFRIISALFFFVVSLILVGFGFDRIVSGYLLDFGFIGVAVAGAFYTFGMTTPFSMMVILELMNSGNAVLFAFIAAFVAALVDCFLFSSLKSILEKNAARIMKRMRNDFSHLTVFFPFLGFISFGLPVPDEIALALLSFEKIELTKVFIVVFLSKFMVLLLFWKSLLA